MADICAVCDKSMNFMTKNTRQGINIHFECLPEFDQNPEKYGGISLKQSVKEDSKYVKYEGKGLIINMKEVNKDIKKNECKKVAEMLPANDRLKYLRECGYFD